MNSLNRFLCKFVSTQRLGAGECWGTRQAVGIIMSGTNCLLGLDFVNCFVFITFIVFIFFLPESEPENMHAIK